MAVVARGGVARNRGGIAANGMRGGRWKWQGGFPTAGFWSLGWWSRAKVKPISEEPEVVSLGRFLELGEVLVPCFRIPLPLSQGSDSTSMGRCGLEWSRYLISIR